MALSFGDMLIEVAWDNDGDERTHAARDWTDVSDYVNSVDGTLRGRSYEIGRPESGVISVEFDNAGGEFTPGRVASPFYPYVKPNRRLRIRGRNLLPVQVATSGGKNRDTSGFWSEDAFTLGSFSVADPPVSAAGSWVQRVTVPSGTAAGSYTALAWFTPFEGDNRTTVSFYVRRVSGTEPASTTAQPEYVWLSGTTAPASTDTAGWTAATSSTLTTSWQRVVTSGMIADGFGSGYARLRLTFPTATTTDVVYEVAAIQAERPSDNIASAITGAEGDATAVLAGWTAPHGNLFQSSTSIHHSGSRAYEVIWDGTDGAVIRILQRGLKPGTTYTGRVWARCPSGTGAQQVTFSVEGAESSSSTTAFDTWQQLTYTFTASAPRAVFTLTPAATPAASTITEADDFGVWEGASVGTETSTGETAWTMPRPIFDGWVESWPVELSPSGVMSTVRVSVSDRLKILSGTTFDNALPISLRYDSAQYVLACNDGSTGNNDSVINTGWSTQTIDPECPVSVSKYGGTWSLGQVEGPTGETAFNVGGNGATNGQAACVTIPYIEGTPPVSGGDDTVPPPPTKTTYEKKFYAAWGRAYDGDGSVYENYGDETNRLYQGYYSSTHGNTKSLIGFDYAWIKNELSGATVLSCSVSFEVMHTYYGSGATIVVGTHTNSSKPSTWQNATSNRKQKSHGSSGNVTVDLGTTIGNEFKAGTTKGVCIGPGPSTSKTYYAYYYGATTTEKPVLTIKYQK